MTEKKILVLLPLQEEDKEYLVSRAQGAAQPCSFEFRKIEEATAEEIAASHIIIGKLPPDKVKCASSLEWLQLPNAGVDAYVAPGVMPADVLLTSGAGAYGLAVSEYMLACSLSLARRFPEYARRQGAHNWKPVGNITSIEGSTVIVLGMGSKGALLLDAAENRLTTVPAYDKAKVVNTVGAGDSLFSAFLHYYVKGLSPEDSLRRAVIFAGIKIGFNGAGLGFSDETTIDGLIGG